MVCRYVTKWNEVEVQRERNEFGTPPPTWTAITR
jgi:hypothetical protein